MTDDEAICRKRIQNPVGQPDGVYASGDNADGKKRQKWAENIMKAYHELASSKEKSDICDLDFILSPDGSVKSEPDGPQPRAPSTANLATSQQRQYPAHFRLPSTLLDRITDDVERIRRKELFAMGCLLYEVVTSHKPFGESTASEVQNFYTHGVFPDDIWTQSDASAILSLWCPEFATELQGMCQQYNPRAIGYHTHIHPAGSFLKYLKEYTRNNPGLMLVSCVSVGALATFPVLGAFGFATTGPVAGTVAAAWQASIGNVGAGSLFALCQSIAMGGAAGTSIATAGITGLSASILAAIAQAFRSKCLEGRPDLLKEEFLAVWRKHNSCVCDGGKI